MTRERVMMLVAGAAVGIVAVVLVLLGNPPNMGFCIACFERDVVGALGLHRAGPVQYLRPEILGIILGALGAALFAKEFRAHGGSSPATRFLLGMGLVGFGSVLLGGCPLRQLISAGGGSTDAAMAVFGMLAGAATAHNFGLAASPKGVPNAGKIAVILGLALCVVVGLLNREPLAKKNAEG